jgi:hypothetical protein
VDYHVIAERSIEILAKRTQAKLIGAGIGGASMEAEIVDSMTGEQIGAVVESKMGTRMPFANLGEWDAAKQVMDDWAKRFKKRLDEVR